MRALKTWYTDLREAVRGLMELDPLKEASSLAFTTILAMPAVLIITLMVASTVYDAQEVRHALFTQAGGFIGADTSEELAEAVGKAQVEHTSLFARITGVVALVLSATAAFAALQGSLNRIWGVEQAPGRAVWRYLFSRLTSLALIACFGFMLLVSLVLDTVLVASAERLGAWLPGRTILVGAAGLVGSFAVVTVVFALVFKLLPDVRVRWRWVWAGAFLTAALFSVGKYLIGLYIARSGAGDAYGAGGAVIVIMLWVYYSAILLLFGAEYTTVVAKRHGEEVHVGRYVRWINEGEVRTSQIGRPTEDTSAGMGIGA